MASIDHKAPFHLIRLRPRVAFLDDDATFLDALMTAIAEADAQFFTEPKSLDELLERTRIARRIERDLWTSIGSGQSAAPLSSVYNYLSSDMRPSVVSIIVVDHMMPGEPGRDYCARHADEGLHRILLTGMADSNLAVQAFNDRSIDYFIPKQSRSLRNLLVRALQDTQARMDDQNAAGLRANADPGVLAALNAPDVQRDLEQLMNTFGVEEYVFLNQPQGLAGVTASGHRVWLQLETRQTLTELADLMIESDTLPDLVPAVLQAQRTVNIELATQLPTLAKIDSTTLRALGTDAQLYAGAFAVARS